MYLYLVLLSGACAVVDRGVWMAYSGSNPCTSEGTAHGKLETLAVVLHEYCVIVGDILCHIVSFIFEPNQIVNANLHYDLCFKTVWYYRSSLVIVKVQHLFWNNWISSFNFLRPFDTAFIRIKMPRENSSVSV